MQEEIVRVALRGPTRQGQIPPNRRGDPLVERLFPWTFQRENRSGLHRYGKTADAAEENANCSKI
jgi:hypothetical protein